MKAHYTHILAGCIFAGLIFWGFGCAYSPIPEYYLLRSGKPPADQAYRSDSNKVTIGLRAVHIAPYLDRPQITIRQGPLEVSRDEYNRWAEPLETMIGTILADRLSMELPDTFVVNFPWSSLMSPSMEIATTIVQLDGTPGGKARLRANWAVISVSGKKPRVLYRAKTTLEKDCPAAGAKALAETINALLNEFGGRVAGVVKELRTKN